MKSAKRPTPRISLKKPAKPARVQVAPLPSAEQRAADNRALVEAAISRVWGSLRVQTMSIAGVEVRFIAVAGAKPHWQFITAGLLVHGAELAFRVLRPKEELTPPAWVWPMLQALIERAGSDALADGQVVRLSAKLAAGMPEVDTDMQAVALGVDPLFSTPLILVAVGLTRDEERLVREWSPRAMLEVLGRVDPSLVTDLERPSTLTSPRTRVIIEQRVEAEGSSLGVMLAQVSEVSGSSATGLSWSLSAEAVETVIALLKGRIGHLRPFSVRAAQSAVELIPSDFPSVERSAEGLVIKLSQPAARQLRATLKAKPGTYQFEALPKFSLAVVA